MVFIHPKNEAGLFMALVLSSGILVLVLFALNRVYRHYLPKLKESPSLFDDIILKAFYRPFVIFLVFITVTHALEMLEMMLKITFPNVTLIQATGMLLTLAWASCRFVNRVAIRVVERSLHPFGMTTASIHAAAYGAKAVILTCFLLMCMDVAGISMSVLLTFGGVGGLAMALAAQETLANFFGGMMIVMERPFRVGDRITIPSQSLEGRVVEIGWRQTKVNSLENLPRYVPNKVFTDSIIENISRVTYRRIKFTLGLEYSMRPKLKEFVERLRELIYNHPQINSSERMSINFTGYGDYSLDVLIHATTRQKGYYEYNTAREEILFSISELLDEMEIELAFPTQTVQFSGLDDVPDTPNVVRPRKKKS